MIRLRRMGARNRPYYRIVVSDSRRTARAQVLEELGHYDPVVNPPRIVLNRERAHHWIGRGAGPSLVAQSQLQTGSGCVLVCSFAHRLLREAARRRGSQGSNSR